MAKLENKLHKVVKAVHDSRHALMQIKPDIELTNSTSSGDGGVEGYINKLTSLLQTAYRNETQFLDLSQTLSKNIMSGFDPGTSDILKGLKDLVTQWKASMLQQQRELRLTQTLSSSDFLGGVDDTTPRFSVDQHQQHLDNASPLPRQNTDASALCLIKTDLEQQLQELRMELHLKDE